GGQRGAGEGQLDGQRIGQQDQAEGNQQQHRENQHGFPRLDPAGGDGTAGGALDPGVELAVGEVVDGAAGRAHHENAGGEDQQQRPRRKIAGGQPQGPPACPQQQQGADGAVHAREHQVVVGLGPGARRQAAGQPGKGFLGTGGGVFGARPRRSGA